MVTNVQINNPKIQAPRFPAMETCDGTWTIQSPGLACVAQETEELAAGFCKRLAVYQYRQQAPCLWVVFAGGTGTGKSTLFNALCGAQLSRTGVERPKTCGPILFAHRQCRIEAGFPYPTQVIRRRSDADCLDGPCAGHPDELLWLEHESDALAHVVLVDTPDLDSVEIQNRRIAADLFLLADCLVFVSSQEKYADEVPFDFLASLVHAKGPFFFLMNKTEPAFQKEELIDAFGQKGLTLPHDRIWLIPYFSGKTQEAVARAASFQDFRAAFGRDMTQPAAAILRDDGQRRLREDLKSRSTRLIAILQGETEAAAQWLSNLDRLYQRVSGDLIAQQSERFTRESRGHLQEELRRVFSRYDLLAKPRQFIRSILAAPLRLLGLIDEDTARSHKETLSRVREKIDLTPVQRAVERFNRSVLEELSPHDERSPLFQGLRTPEIALTDGEIEKSIFAAQEGIGQWLEETFKTLSARIPKRKKWGIYSTSALWGVLILILETAVGGGFTILDAVLDSALAPFVTRGAVELFAYHELQKVARELSSQYQEGLTATLRQQRDRYMALLRSLMTPDETLDRLEAWQRIWK